MSILGNQELIFGKIGESVGRTENIIVGVENGLLIQNVDLALEVLFGTNWDQNANRSYAELLLHFFDNIAKVGSDTVHLIDEHDAGNVVFGCLSPNSLGLRLHSGDPAENNNRSV